MGSENLEKGPFSGITNRKCRTILVENAESRLGHVGSEESGGRVCCIIEGRGFKPRSALAWLCDL